MDLSSLARVEEMPATKLPQGYIVEVFFFRSWNLCKTEVMSNPSFTIVRTSTFPYPSLLFTSHALTHPYNRTLRQTKRTGLSWSKGLPPYQYNKTRKSCSVDHFPTTVALLCEKYQHTTVKRFHPSETSPVLLPICSTEKSTRLARN